MNPEGDIVISERGQLTEEKKTPSELLEEAGKKLNGKVGFFNRLINFVTFIIDRGRMSMWLLIVATALLTYTGKLTGDDCKTLFIIYVCLAVGGEVVAGELISRYMGPPKGGANG